MRTIIKYKDGHLETARDVVPVFDFDNGGDNDGHNTLCGVDREGSVMTVDIDLKDVARVIVELEETNEEVTDGR